MAYEGSFTYVVFREDDKKDREYNNVITAQHRVNELRRQGFDAYMVREDRTMSKRSLPA